MLSNLNLELYEPQLIRKEDRIFDPIRKKWLLETKEEIVRQLMLTYLTTTLNYGTGRIAVEKKVALGNTFKRFDILIYDEHLHPFILIECKSFNLNIRQDAINQAARYNIALKAPYICITNGKSSFTARVDFHNMSIEYLPNLPSQYKSSN